MVPMRPLLTMLLVLACSAASARACNVPVFRYALENWPADPYDVWVYHDQPLTEEQSQLIAALRKQIVGTKLQQENLLLDVLDVTKDMPPKAKAMYEKHKPSQHPWLIVQFPKSHADDPPAYSGPLTQEAVAHLADSPLRHSIAKLILEGNSAVWVLVETGDKEKDDAAAKVLTENVKRLEKELRLPTLQEDDKKYFDAARGPRLRLAIEVLRLSRDDNAEAMLIRMLEGWNPKLIDKSQPMAFAFFGRGRVLPPLVGELIEARYIEDACIFLVGRCTCQLKDDNPGWDVLFPVEWEGAIDGNFTLADAKPMLTTTAAAQQQNKELAAATGTGDVTAMTQGVAQGEVPAMNTAGGGGVVATSAQADGSPGSDSKVMRNVLIVAGVFVVVMIAATMWMKTRRTD